MPKLKTPEYPAEFIELNEEFIEIKGAYEEVRNRYKELLQRMAENNWRAGHVHRVSPLPYPTLRKWMGEPQGSAYIPKNTDPTFLEGV